MAKIFLIGFMGSGKTFLGRQLASALNVAFFDLDELVENQEAATISEIFSSKGEEYFRAIESNVLRSLNNLGKAVIATGGGTPCYHNNMEWMNEQGITVFLEASIQILYERLHPEVNQRPMLQGKSGEDLQRHIENKLTERIPFYSKAHIIFNSEKTSLSELTEEIRNYPASR